MELVLSQGIQMSSVGIFLTSEEEYWRLTARAWFDVDSDVTGTLAGQLLIPGQGYIRSETSVTIKSSTREGRVVLIVPKVEFLLTISYLLSTAEIFYLNHYFKY